MPGDHIEDILSLWRELPNPSGMSVLDAGSGSGKTTRALACHGIRVVATVYDSHPAAEVPEGVEIMTGVDLNKPFPVEDEAFDGVNLKDVIEHLESAAAVIREIARILKPGGVLVLSTPNMLNVSSRLRIFLTGFHEGRKRPISYAKTTGDAGNVYVPTFHQLHYLLAQSGMRIERMALGAWSFRSLLLAVLFYPLILAGTWLSTFRVRKHDLLKSTIRRQTPEATLDALQEKQKRVQRDLFKLMISWQLLLGRNLILRARKTGQGPMDA